MERSLLSSPRALTLSRAAPALLASLAALGPDLASAQTCEANFRTEGDPRNGAEYATSATLAGVSPGSALGQLQAIATADGFRVLHEDAAAGTLTLEQSKDVRPFLIHWTARASGPGTAINVATRLNRGATARPEAIRSGMCGMIARIVPGPRGDAIAAQARAGGKRGQVVATTAIALGEELGKARRTTTPEILSARYQGRRYTIDGQVSAPVEGFRGYEVWFSVYQGNGSWLLGQTRTQRNSYVWPVVVCTMAADHVDRATKLKEKDWATLTGTVRGFVPGAPDKLELDDCRFN